MYSQINIYKVISLCGFAVLTVRDNGSAFQLLMDGLLVGARRVHLLKGLKNTVSGLTPLMHSLYDSVSGLYLHSKCKCKCKVKHPSVVEAQSNCFTYGTYTSVF